MKLLQYLKRRRARSSAKKTLKSDPKTRETRYEPESYRLFVHRPLPEGKYFRILRLLPGNFNDPIKCEVIITAFEKAPPYEPISYCWGDNTADRKEILCEGLPFPIPSNLFEALRCFRLTTKPRLLWVDGLCINQGSDVEKGHQVAFMGEIYSRGECTLVWLGEAEGIDVKGAFHLIREFNAYMHAEIDKMDTTHHVTFWDTINRVPAFPADHPLRLDERRWQDLSLIIDRPWFRRVWVIQEVGLSRNVRTFCGNNSIPFGEIVLFSVYHSHMEVFVEICRIVETRRLLDPLESIWSTFGVSKSWLMDGYTLEKSKRFYEDFGISGLLDVLSTGRKFIATKSVDHIYAFLGHPSAKDPKTGRNIIEPDYSLSVKEVHRMLAANLCVATQSLNMLCFVQDCTDEENNDITPSWVPRWDESSWYSDIAPNVDMDVSCSAETKNLVKIEVSGNELHVHALLLDTVKVITSEFDDDVVRTVKESWNVYQRHKPIPPQEHPDNTRYWAHFVWTLLRSYPNKDYIKGDFVAFCKGRIPSLYQIIAKQKHFEDAMTPTVDTSVSRFEREMNSVCVDRKFFMTERGFCGTGFRYARKGDILAIIFGCPMPMLLSSTSVSSVYHLAGQSFVEEIIFGQGVSNWKQGKYPGLKTHDITII
jgi:heterokaryon incompatibility protein (HET)